MYSDTPNHLAGAGKVIETKPAPSAFHAECVFIGRTVSPKVEIDLSPTSNGSFSGIGNFQINGNGKNVVYPEGSE